MILIIDIYFCDEVTDTSLFTVVDNFPNLIEIGLDFDKVHITKAGLMELLKKCPQLVDMGSDEYNIPKEIKQQLKKRKNDDSEDGDNYYYDDYNTAN